jgi:hypothetical protein
MSGERGPSPRNSANRAIQFFADPRNMEGVMKHVPDRLQKAKIQGNLRATSSQIRAAYPMPKYYKLMSDLAKNIDTFEEESVKIMGHKMYKKYGKIPTPMTAIVHDTVKKMRNELKAYMHECMFGEVPIADATTAVQDINEMLDFELMLSTTLQNRTIRQQIMSNQAAAMRNLFDYCKEYVVGYEWANELSLFAIKDDMKHVYIESAWNDKAFANFKAVWEMLKAKHPNMPPMKAADVETILSKIKLLAIGFKVDSSIRKEDLTDMIDFKKKVSVETLSAENETKIRNLLTMTDGGARGKRKAATKKRIGHSK